MTVYSIAKVYQNVLNQSSVEGHLVLDSCNNELSFFFLSLSLWVCVCNIFVYLLD